MTISGGLAGKILRIDLGSREISTEDTERYAERFIGGRAISNFILLNEMNPETKWSDPENMLIFGVGCLVGTLAPGACRVSVDAKNVFNNGKGSANFGGHFGAELKYAGFDHVVISGRAENPVYLWIEDGKAELRDASSIWGKTTWETEEILQEELGDNRIEVASIGPAGENLVRGSGIIHDYGKAAGGSGVGCIMGNKKLKALAVRGHGSIKIAQPERFFDAANAIFEKIKTSPLIPRPHKSSIEKVLFPESKEMDWWCIVRNGQDEHWPIEKKRRLLSNDQGVPKYIKRITAGFACPAGCIPFLEIDEGKYKGTKGMGYWVNSAWYSERLDVDEPAASLRFHLLANQLGLDADAASVVLSWAFECYEKGLLTKGDADGLELEWGNEDAMIEMLEKLAYRRGIGDFLADGVREASRKLGKGSEKFAVHMKGQDSADPYRIVKGWGLAVSLSPVAGRHLRGTVTAPGSYGPPNLTWSVTEYDNQPEAVFWQARAKEIEDMTGICSILGAWGSQHSFELRDFSELISSAMGVDLQEEELMLIGRRAINLEKAFNTVHTDFDRKDDLPPRRYMEEPVKSGPFAGLKCDKEKWDEMLDKYYELQGWDKSTGLQTRACLEELSMEDVKEKLEQVGKLIDR
ncbi:aldehyde ferredoxin oxidoreductase family protein [Chloroflexota bacterium]